MAEGGDIFEFRWRFISEFSGGNSSFNGCMRICLGLGDFSLWWLYWQWHTDAKIICSKQIELLYWNSKSLVSDGDIGEAQSVSLDVVVQGNMLSHLTGFREVYKMLTMSWIQKSRRPEMSCVNKHFFLSHLLALPYAIFHTLFLFCLLTLKIYSSNYLTGKSKASFEPRMEFSVSLE